MISFDTETTGVDIRHGAQPFLVTTCRQESEPEYWEWDIDPNTRNAIVDKSDWREVVDLIESGEQLVLQNPKFDVAAIHAIDPNVKWPWHKTYDTLLAGHLLASSQPHDLTTMTLIYLGINVQPFEDHVKKIVNKAKSEVKRENYGWRLAAAGLPEMPSAKGSVWKYDMWLPRAYAKHVDLPSDHEYWTACSEYANSDSYCTIRLWEVFERLLHERGLWRIYEERLKLLPIIYKMEASGITYSRQRLNELLKLYRAESEAAADTCKTIAAGYGFDLELPKTGNNKSLLTCAFDVLEFPVVKSSKKTGAPSLDKSVMEHYLAELEPGSDQLRFIEALAGKRSRDTAMTYMDGYERFSIGCRPGWRKLFPSLNPTGTATLRFSSSNPNEQNISKKKGFNLRYCFGPLPGREWWSLDASNIELRIPAYESGESEMIALFERPDEPPFYGSNHLLIFSILHPDKFEEHGAACKDIYKSTWYQWTKNGNFAVQYGAVEESGTADRAYHVPGAQRRIQERFSRLSELNERMVATAEEYGYVETVPDKTVDPDRGYPLECGRTNWGKVRPTVPLNYHVQGTAMWWMMKAMIRVQAYLDELNAVSNSPGYYMIMQVHDELVFDFPKGANEKSNMPKIRKIKRLMEQGGNDIGIPTPVGISYHPNNWSE